jgi:ActR/RegA family two-component response regulator
MRAQPASDDDGHEAAPIKVLLIDDSEAYRQLLIRRFERSCPGIEIDEYDPMTRGRPGPDFDWQDYQLVLLDFELGLAKETGLHWLRDIVSYGIAPPIIILTEMNSTRAAVHAIKLGAQDYLLKNNLDQLNPMSLIARATQPDEFSEEFGLTSDLEAMVSEKTDSFASSIGEQMEKLDDTQVTILKRRVEDHVSKPPSLTSPTRLAVDHQQIKVPGYEIVRKLAEGGMSSVLLTERIEDRLPVVLKLMSTEESEDPAALKRFMQEYTLISELDHPNVVRIYERAFARDYAYIAMEYFPCGDLNDKLRSGLQVQEALSYCRQIASALCAVHELDIVHRDLKPGNVLFREDNSLCLTDFGVAKDLGIDTELTMHNMMIGTPYYMSPEQALGSNVDARSDLYSLGVLFFQMLTGNKPFQARSIADLIGAHIKEPVPRLPDHFAKYQPIIDGLLEKDPDERFQSAHELLAGLEWIE